MSLQWLVSLVIPPHPNPLPRGIVMKMENRLRGERGQSHYITAERDGYFFSNGLSVRLRW